jgi:hypothetical protein
MTKLALRNILTGLQKLFIFLAQRRKTQNKKMEENGTAERRKENGRKRRKESSTRRMNGVGAVRKETV